MKTSVALSKDKSVDKDDEHKREYWADKYEEEYWRAVNRLFDKDMDKEFCAELGCEGIDEEYWEKLYRLREGKK